MGLTALDIVVLLLVGGGAVLGLKRGFVTEVLSLMVWIFIVFALKFLHAPVTAMLTGIVGTAAGAAVLAFALVAGVVYFGGRLVANMLGERTRSSILGPIDRALGFGFGALKGLILASLGFLLIILVTDTIGGGPNRRPTWITKSRTYPVLNITSAGIADFVDKRRKGEAVFPMEGNASAANESDSAP
ncbi:CvpA family protein [Sphingomonas sp. 28-62-11]|uniref:CvpA family protein n=1 Tax=Sphingomonas sp. 28-62-11 TaxID=1970432 RepID=UPI000BD98B76|nr:MAG: colicin V production protein [Sphingomonas sp. 28-62-11]